MSDLDNDIRQEYGKHGSLFKTAKAFNVQVEYVRGIVGNMPVDDTPDVSTCAWDGFGDPAKRKHLVARSLAKTSWDNGRPEVAEARAKFEAGTHEMATGRDGPWLLMYAFPRAVVKPRPHYFQPMVEA
jgi:hypothetical protein